MTVELDQPRSVYNSSIITLHYELPLWYNYYRYIYSTTTTTTLLLPLLENTCYPADTIISTYKRLPVKIKTVGKEGESQLRFQTGKWNTDEDLESAIDYFAY